MSTATLTVSSPFHARMVARIVVPSRDSWPHDLSKSQSRKVRETGCSGGDCQCGGDVNPIIRDEDDNAVAYEWDGDQRILTIFEA